METSSVPLTFLRFLFSSVKPQCNSVSMSTIPAQIALCRHSMLLGSFTLTWCVYCTVCSMRIVVLLEHCDFYLFLFFFLVLLQRWGKNVWGEADGVVHSGSWHSEAHAVSPRQNIPSVSQIFWKSQRRKRLIILNCHRVGYTKAKACSLEPSE